MRWNVVELSRNGLYVKLYRGFLLVMEGEAELGRVVIDEMGSLLLTAEQATLSKPVMVRLAKHGIPIVVCGSNYHPISINLPYSNHHYSNKLLQCQIACSKPLKKRLWQKVVQQKILHQRFVLQCARPNFEAKLKQLQRLSDKTRSGDPENTEAQAARIYWQALMGESFRRDTEAEDGINSALNYGYTVMRAACARAICAAGLHPSLGIYHSNQSNPFCLADDLMEVYRPLVDLYVFQQKIITELTPVNKQALAQLLQLDISYGEQTTTVNSSMQYLAFSLVKSYENKSLELTLPQLVPSG